MDNFPKTRAKLAKICKRIDNLYFQGKLAYDYMNKEFVDVE
jgi:hypothetical protein